jgi:hypothetical protein
MTSPIGWHEQERLRRGRGSPAPGPEDGGRRPADRWPGPRLQQPAGRHFGLVRDDRRCAWRRAAAATSSAIWRRAKVRPRRAAALTHRLLAFSRRQTLAPKPVVINRLMADLVELVRRTVGPAIEVETIAAGGLWPTLVDANQLENALLNLCINARDAMPTAAGSRSRPATNGSTPAPRASTRLDPGQYVTVCVSDTGSGIDKAIAGARVRSLLHDQADRRGHGPGTVDGLRLRAPVDGHVRIYSEVGQGTMVCIYLPRHLGAEEAEPAQPIGAPAAHADRPDDPGRRRRADGADAGRRCAGRARLSPAWRRPTARRA